MRLQVCSADTALGQVIAEEAARQGHAAEFSVELPDERQARGVSLLLILDGDGMESGLALVRRAAARWRTRGEGPALLGVTKDPGRVIALLEAGADDWLLWPTTGALFDARLRAAHARISGHDSTLDAARFGRELHDGLGQLLAGAALIARGVEGELDATAAAKVGRIAELVAEAGEHVRKLAAGLPISDAEERSLDVLLENVAARSRAIFQIDCTVEDLAALWTNEGAAQSSPLAVAQLELIASEAINNAVRHGHARRVVLSLTREGAQGCLTITDDGVGLSSEPRPGVGLRSMRQRARSLGGGIELANAVGGGAQVRCLFSEGVPWSR